MTKEREALKLALEALETVRHKIDSYQVNVCDDVDEAITAIREALAKQPAQRKPLTDEQLEAMAENYVTNCYFDTLKYARAIEAAHGITGEQK